MWESNLQYVVATCFPSAVCSPPSVPRGIASLPAAACNEKEVGSYNALLQTASNSVTASKAKQSPTSEEGFLRRLWRLAMTSLQQSIATTKKQGPRSSSKELV